MKIRRWSIILIITGLICNSCIDEYWPDLDKYENLLVVDGYISNEPGPYTVKLSYSSKVGELTNNPATGASITIIDDLGDSELLTETEPGTYVTSANGIQGLTGRKYKIEIQTSAGKNYESEFEELLTPTEIESVNAELESRTQDGLSHNLIGYQFYLNSAPALSDTNYYLARLEATFQYNADFLIRFIYNGTLNAFTNSDSLQTCWRTYKVHEIFTYSTLNLTEPVVTDFPLHYVSTETRELYIRYSLLVKQFTISEKTYRFWDGVKDLNADQGGLYNTQPYQIRGNVVNRDNTGEPVLGYFMVAGVAQKRIFIAPPSPAVYFYFPVCVLTDWDYENFGSIFSSTPVEWPMYATMDNNGSRAMPVQECMDCRLNGGTVVKPDFWEE